jgi:hypothetical protein
MMKRFVSSLTTIVVLALFSAPLANADFGFQNFDFTLVNQDGTAATQAGSHPFALNSGFDLNTTIDPLYGDVPDGQLKTLVAKLPPGLVGSPLALPRCDSVDFLTEDVKGYPSCPNSTAIGLTRAHVGRAGGTYAAPVYNLVPPPGVPVKIGFFVAQAPVTIEIGVNQDPPYNVVARLVNVTQTVEVRGGYLQVWGVPTDPVHDSLRGRCLRIDGKNGVAFGPFESNGICPTNLPQVPFLTLPRSCQGPSEVSYEGVSWQTPLAPPVIGSILTHDTAEPPNPQGTSGCGKLAFGPSVAAKPTSLAAQSPSGLDFSLDVKDEGLTNPTGLAQSDLRHAVVTLPPGMTINPSQAEGLSVCTESDLARETLNSEPGAGCPNASKIGTVEVESPLVDEALKGSLFVAAPYENPFGSLVAVYLVFKNPTLGIIVKQALKVETDPQTGQITTIADEVPQLPFSHFRLRFREGTRSPLATPPTCDADPTTPGRDPFTVNAELTPWKGGSPTLTTAAFEIITGPSGGPCPAGGIPPYHPDLLAGTSNNAAGSYSPFNVRIARSDSEQEITNFSIKLPPGVTGKLAGIPSCSDEAIAAAKARERTHHGGQEELDSPSCPAASEVGRTLVGAGVGPSLTYVPGKIYLAGPYHGAPLSIVAITAAKAGPFDLGTVVVRYALKINPETAEVFVDATGSDPIPHIVNGIPVHLRDIRAYVNRPDFVLNPTSCAPTSTASTVLGSGLDFASSADDVPVTVSSPFQAADCASLPYKPRLSVKLKGGTKRGQNPALTAVLQPRPGDANSKRISVALPHSEFLDQSHIKTICTRVQFKAGDGNGSACPAGSVYGTVKAWTPLLDNPLQGNVYLRSSEHPLPDLVLALHGQVEFTAVGRIDSLDGGIRNTFEAVPDAPITKVEVRFEGGKKGLLVNSTNICKGKHRAQLEYTAHSGKGFSVKAPLQAKCKKAPKTKARTGTQRAWRVARGW